MGLLAWIVNSFISWRRGEQGHNVLICSVDHNRGYKMCQNKFDILIRGDAVHLRWLMQIELYFINDDIYHRYYE